VLPLSLSPGHDALLPTRRHRSMLPCHAFTNSLQTAPGVEGRTPSSHTSIVAQGTTSGERMHKARHTAGQRVLDHTRGRMFPLALRTWPTDAEVHDSHFQRGFADPSVRSDRTHLLPSDFHRSFGLGRVGVEGTAGLHREGGKRPT
jgi:hypothetical protein